MYGEQLAKDAVFDILGKQRKHEYISKSINEIFDPNLSTIYFEDLRKIISKEWGSFENIFETSKKKLSSPQAINKYRSDAHAKDITPDEFTIFRLSIEKIENDIARYFS